MWFVTIQCRMENTLSIHETRVACEFIQENFGESHESYQKEWMKRFIDRRAFAKADAANQLRMIEVGNRWGVDVKTAFDR